MIEQAAPVTDWLLIDIDGEQVHFGTWTPGGKDVARYRSYRSSDHATATDCIMHYAREAAVPLQARRAAVVVSGAVGADSIRVARSRWIVSKTGLELLFGARPIFLNDSVAKAWANVALGRLPVRIVGGERQPDFAAPGKTVVLNYATGLGGAVIHVPESGTAFVTETECGHIGFAPETDLERELGQQLARLNPRVTYERVLTLGRDDPVWGKLSRAVEPAERELLRAAVLGAFAGDLVLAYTAWAGVFLDGERCGFLAEAAASAAFNDRFADKGHFRMNVRAAPRWLAPASDHNLNGVAHMLATQHSSEPS